MPNCSLCPLAASHVYSAAQELIVYIIVNSYKVDQVIRIVVCITFNFLYLYIYLYQQKRYIKAQFFLSELRKIVEFTETHVQVTDIQVSAHVVKHVLTHIFMF